MNLIQRIAASGVLVGALASPVIAEERRPEEYAKEIQGNLFRSGWLDHLSPENASAEKESSYRIALDGILAFLQEYPEARLPEDYRQLRRDCVSALVKNLFVEDKKAAGAGVGTPGINELIWERLRKERILDFGRQLDDILQESNLTYNRALVADEEEREIWRAYNERLAEQADRVIGLMLATRYRFSAGKVNAEDVERVITTEREAYDKLQGLGKKLKAKDYGGVIKELKGYTEKQKEGFDKITALIGKAAEQGITETADRTTVADEKGNVYVVTKAFAREWGDNGENAYGVRDKIRKNSTKIEGITKKLKTEFALDYSNNARQEDLTEGRVPTVIREAVLPEALNSVLDVGDKINIQIIRNGNYDRDGNYTVVGFCTADTAYLSGEPGLFLPIDLGQWRLMYLPKDYKEGDMHHVQMSK